MSGRRLCVFGSRSAHPTPRDIDLHLFSRFGLARGDIDAILCGMAPGADESGFQWATGLTYRGYRTGVPQLHFDVMVIACHADWDKHGKVAGHIRNEHMAKHCDVALGFWCPNSGGTANMTAWLSMLGVEHVLVDWRGQ